MVCNYSQPFHRYNISTIDTLTTSLPNTSAIPCTSSDDDSSTTTPSPPIKKPLTARCSDNAPVHRAIVTKLEEWHHVHRTGKPLFRYGREPKLPSRVFDRLGREVQLRRMNIATTVSYDVLVLHPIGGPPMIVVCHPTKNQYGTFLREWRGVRDGLDPQCCALRIFMRGSNRANFPDDAFDWIDTLDTSSSPALRRAPRSPSSVIYLDAEVPTPSSRRWSRQLRPTVPKNYQLPGDDVSVADGPTISPSSNRRPPASNTKPSPSNPRSPSLVFEILFHCYGAMRTRAFPLTECRSSEQLFGKVQDFCHVFDPETRVNVLSCRIPSQPERLVFRGSEGEFDLLVRSAREGKAANIQIHPC
ncbi:hypothetical protein P168DRAFT_330805 [Aspergillus campestris IBT 28561]|uniref:Uncharacterized protein n=1 Tax=Aspergillus campestris (strain IBT 28561) TaxID=1392248 RepID=A0A2I1CQT5_ASPC2|nr:uncharacterized protein P168DRAFT_330805 [Aspergillus campestris IBT 28561]PKX99990.1 hypothetical protein P168DRAFT_330805 [Aspergillus campestris IBT 28561]